MARSIMILILFLFASCRKDCEMICTENMVYSKKVNGVWTQFKKESRPRKTSCEDYSWTETYVNKEGEFVKVYHGIHCK